MVYTKGKPVTALVSDSVAALFSAQAESVHPSQIQIPVNASPGQATVPPWAGRFWFMGGDTDFSKQISQDVRRPAHPLCGIRLYPCRTPAACWCWRRIPTMKP